MRATSQLPNSSTPSVNNTQHAMSSDIGGAGWTRPSWFSPASDAIAGSAGSASARASHRRRQRSRGADAAAHNTITSKSQRSNRRGSMGDRVGATMSGDRQRRSTAGRRQRNRQRRPTPTLTVILMRLEASMTSYCSELSTPTAPNARRAARVLDIDNLGDSVDPILEAEWARMVDPLTLLAGAEAWYGGLEHLAQQQQQKASASTNKEAGSRRQRSRIKRGTMIATNGSSQRMDSGIMSAAEPSQFSSPNGADMPAPSSHDDDVMPSSSFSPEAERIRSIYGKVMKDLGILKEILCDPIMAASKGENENEPSSSVPEGLIPPARPTSDTTDDHQSFQIIQNDTSRQQQQQQAAESLSKTLATLVELCEIRRAIIAIHCDIVALGSICTTNDEITINAPASSGRMAVASALNSSLLDLAHRCDEVRKTLPKDASTSSSATAPMVESMRHEIDATKSALRMMAHLENLSFFETVIEMKRLETRLCPSSPFHSDPPCALEMWLRQIFREALSLMSIYYDRIDAYANSSLGYGFQRHIMVEDKTGQQQLSKVPSAVAAAGTLSSAAHHPQGGSPSVASQGLASHSGQRTTWYGHVHDLDSEVIDFLHVHEEKNGPALAVALIFDAKYFSGKFERGFSVKNKEATKATNNSGEIASPPGTEEAWSAGYLRTSTKAGDPDFETKLDAGNASSLRRVGPRKMGMSLSNLLSSGTEGQGLRIKRPSYGGNTSRGSLTSIVSDSSLGLDGSEVTKLVSPIVKAAEYGFLQSNASANENDKSSAVIAWPHSEMEEIVSILKSDSNESTYETSHSPHSIHETERTNHFKNTSPKFVVSTPTRPLRRNNPFNFSPLIEEPEEQSLNESGISSPVRSITASFVSPASPSSPRRHIGSSYHFAQVQEKVWLSVIIKGDDEGGRQRRRTSRGGLTDEEIRMWLGHFAAKLRLHKMFGPKSITSARKISKGLSLPAGVPSTSRAIVTSDDAVLVSLKESFGMRHSSSPLASRPLKSPYVRKERMSFRGIRSGSLPELLVQDEGASAAAFFLGADLGQALTPYGM